MHLQLNQFHEIIAQIAASGLRRKSDKVVAFINAICLRKSLLQEQMNIFYICGLGFLRVFLLGFFCSGGVNFSIVN